MAVKLTTRINDSDITVSTPNRPRPGGQQVGMVTSAVVAEHSCGISVQVGVLRSQQQNRTLAMVVLALALDFAEHLESGTMSKEDLQAIWNAKYGKVENEEAYEQEESKV